jgi:phosphomannomutase
LSELIISVSGLRGVIGTSLTPDVIMRYVAAFVADLPPGPIVVARDGRTTGEMIRDTISGALVASGREVFDAGIAATPTVGVVVRALDAVAGIQISASHNPPEYNGIKLFGADGRVIGASAGKRVRDLFHANTVAWRSFDEIGQVVRLPNPHDHHLAKVLATVDVAAIAKRRFRVLIDSNHGAGGLLGSRLLEELGCDVVTIGGVPDGLFDHPPEPTAENLAAVADKVSQFGCDIGFCQDPDADRLALIDANGHYVGEEYTVALCMMRRFEDASGVVVINCATSGMTEWLAARAGATCRRSAVGEANVCDAMIAQDAVYGGEGNGGPIDPRVGMVRDSFVGMAQILDLMQRRGQTLAELVAEIPPLAIHKSKVSVDTTLLPKIFDQLCRAMPDASADLQDGLRLAWPDSWLLVRGSNTEPIVRLIAESPTQSRSSSLCDAAAAVIAKIG